MSFDYVELHCHSNYSFKEGASSIEELLGQVKILGQHTLALTDHDNLCGAMEFARMARWFDIHPVTGAEVTLTDSSHLTLLAKSRVGYSNLSNLISNSYMGKDGGRLDPKLAPYLLGDNSEGIILLTGCSKGKISRCVTEGRFKDAYDELRYYIDRFGSENVFVELQQNLVYGDTFRNRELVALARRLQVNTVATNNVHYHIPERHKLQDALVAIQHNKMLDETHMERRPNSNFYLKTAEEMGELFRHIPEAITNTLHIAERCEFNLLEDLGYAFPKYPVPSNHTHQSYLELVCKESAVRKYGSITPKIHDRLDREFRLIELHGLAGFFLIYYEVIQIARQVMIDLGLGPPGVFLEEWSPGRGRGSSVAMLVGYLIGLSHVDPLEYDLTLDRFINEEMGSVPDIDLDFPREIREELVKRVHDKYGWDHAAFTGAISTYKTNGCVQDLGKVLGLPSEDVDRLSNRVDTHSEGSLKMKMAALPEMRHKIDEPIWCNLADLASVLDGFPKYLAQHPSGMIISSSPLIDMVPVQPGAINNRYVCHWDKHSVSDAGFVKIDFLALGALSQMQEALILIKERTGEVIDLSRIDFDDQEVYASINKLDTIGVFQIESAAQMQTLVHLKPHNLREMAYEVAAVRPGVGINGGVRQFIARYRDGVEWEYTHPSEKKALERTKGVILFQDQVNELAMHVAGFRAQEADQLRRAFSRKNNKKMLQMYWEQFKFGAAQNGVPESNARTIFRKFSGQYMFPESHAYAFGITAYQMSWLKYYYPLEFFVAIFNQQPMGFYNLETLKEDAKRRYGIRVLNPDINKSQDRCTIRDDRSFWLGLLNVKNLGRVAVDVILRERKGEIFSSLHNFINRTGLRNIAVESLIVAGAFDSIVSDRRMALWEAGLIYRPVGTQRVFPIGVEQDMADLVSAGKWETMLGEYRTMGTYPSGHLMAHLRDQLPSEVITSYGISKLEGGSEVVIAGLVIRRQHPSSNAFFITLEDEFGHVPLVLWPDIFNQYRLVILEPILKVRGVVSRLDSSFNVVVRHVESIPVQNHFPLSRDWG